MKDSKNYMIKFLPEINWQNYFLIKAPEIY